jgi:hypothetical protein
MLPWIYWLVFTVGAGLFDKFVDMTPSQRKFYRVVVLILALLWLLVLIGVPARLGIA